MEMFLGSFCEYPWVIKSGFERVQRYRMWIFFKILGYGNKFYHKFFKELTNRVTHKRSQGIFVRRAHRLGPTQRDKLSYMILTNNETDFKKNANFSGCLISSGIQVYWLISGQYLRKWMASMTAWKPRVTFSNRSIFSSKTFSYQVL